MHGALATVESWLLAINDGRRDDVLASTADDIEVVGPRGSARGKEVLAAWLDRAGFTSTPLRWFCGADGRVVVEQRAMWGSSSTSIDVASAFVVREQHIARYQRFDSLASALAAAGLTPRDEVSSRCP